MAERHRECCNDAACDSGLRNHYFEGKRLTADAFRVEQHYLVERRRLLNRAIHGWGVVYGFGVESANSVEVAGRLTIRPGLALDACGRELLRVHGAAVGFDDVVLVDDKGKRLSQDVAGIEDAAQSRDPKQAQRRPCWLLSAHYAEQSLDPVPLRDPCSCDRTEWDHVCETVRFSLQRIDCAECCDARPCMLDCECGTGPCCDERAGHTGVAQRGGCRCLCDHLIGLPIQDDCACLTEIEEPCTRVRVDLRHGVPLACIALRKDECDRWTFDREVEPCGPRRLVKRNDLLFDLIRGCDLTRISAIGWAPWHRREQPVPLTDFQDSFGTEDAADTTRNLTRDYWVEFSRPVRASTVRPDCFSITVTVPEDEAGWGESRRVPIVDVIRSGGPDAALITHARLVVDAGWVHDATKSRKKIFNQDEALVEIAIHGDYIVDCNGQTVDANAVGLVPSPSGNGTPGGTFHSNFRVAPRDTQGVVP